MNVKEDFLKQHKKVSKKNTGLKSLRYIIKNREEISHSRKKELKNLLDKSGINLTVSQVSWSIFVLGIVATLFLNTYVFYYHSDWLYGNPYYILISMIVFWSLVLWLVTGVLWLMLYGITDIAMFRRRQKLEDVLPDYLMLVSSNIRAGMTIDQALWCAMRPRFGILAKEIEDVAKKTFVGEPLEDALKDLVRKYDSKMLERSVSLLLEGIRAGGEIGELLEKIASNIQDTLILKKEMAANVMTYIIFISFATIFAAPFLFGIAFQLIIAISAVFSKIDIAPGAASGFSISVSNSVISLGDFRIFAIVSLIITSFFSSIIISTIQKGTIKGGLKYVPAFIISSVVLFLLVSRMFGYMVAGFF